MTVTEEKDINETLEYLRGEIRAERISYGEIAFLQSIMEHIPDDDVELLQWADVPEGMTGREYKKVWEAKK